MKKLLWFATAVIVVTLIYTAMYAVGQQVLRTSANDPQIQLAEDTATNLDKGENIAVLNAGPKTDIAASLAPFVLVYDSKTNLVASTAVLDGANPVVPPGVLTAAASASNNVVTWQPRKGVRVAAVVIGYNNGYVLAGRSLRQVEKRETSILYVVVAAWAVTIGTMALVAGLTHLASKRG